MMELTARYGLEFDPFLKNSKDILFKGSEFSEASVRLKYLSETRGFGLLTGQPGCGKTTVARSWADSMNPSKYRVAYTCLSTLTVMEFYRNLALILGLEPAHTKTMNFRLIQDEIDRLSLDQKKTPVIIIDEANYISGAMLNDLKMLFNFEMDSKDRAIVLLVGLPQLNHTLNLAIHEPLRQRLVMSYRLDGLSKEEGREYIALKLKGAGCISVIFEDAAEEAVLNAANGVPRMIDRICSQSLVIGNAEGKDHIGPETVMEAVNEISL